MCAGISSLEWQPVWSTRECDRDGLTFLFTRPLRFILIILRSLNIWLRYYNVFNLSKRFLG